MSTAAGIAIVATIGVVLLLVAGLAVVVGVHRPQGHRSAAGLSDAAALMTLTTHLGSLDESHGFTVAVTGPSTPLKQSSGPCHSPVREHPAIGRYADWSYLLQRDGFTRGDISVQAIAASSPDVVAREQAYFASSAYLSCLERDASDDLTSRFPRGSGRKVTGATASIPPTQSVPAAADEFWVKVDYSTPTGSQYEWAMVNHLFAGRFMIRITAHVCACLEQVNAQMVRDVVAELQPRLAAVASK